MNAIIFDVDNTLYDVNQYFSGAFKHISKYISDKYNVNRDEVYKKLMDLWKEKTSMYAYLFNDFLNEYNLEKNELPTLINLFNNYDGKLKLYDDAKSTLKILKEKYYKLGIITDGNLLKQKRKIKLLGIDNFLNIIIYTKELDVSKPSPTPFEKALKELNVYPKNSFYVGDNPLVDFKGAKESGMNTIRIMKGEFKSLPSDDYIDCEIKNLKELLSIV